MTAIVLNHGQRCPVCGAEAARVERVLTRPHATPSQRGVRWEARPCGHAVRVGIGSPVWLGEP